jgi:choline-glycine betaine transporter
LIHHKIFVQRPRVVIRVRFAFIEITMLIEKIRTKTRPDQIAKKTSPVIDWPVFILSGGFLMLFVATALFDIDLLSATVNSAFGGATQFFGAYWQVLMLVTFLTALYVAVSDSGKARLGNLSAPDISTYKWVAIIMCTLLAGGGVFWAAAEPMAHFISSPPLFAVESGSPEAVYPALAQSYMHWGFLSWSI